MFVSDRWPDVPTTSGQAAQDRRNTREMNARRGADRSGQSRY